MKYYVHNVPGRLRIKLPSIKNNPDGLNELEAVIKNLDTVQIDKASTLTGSVVLTYGKHYIGYEAILGSLEKAGLIDLSNIIDNSQYIKDAITTTGKSLNKAIAGFFLGNAFDNTPLSFISIFV